MRNLCEVWFSRESGNINHLTQWFWTAHLARGQGSSSLPPEIPLWKGPGVDSPAPGNQPRHANQDILLHLNFFAPQTMSAESVPNVMYGPRHRIFRAFATLFLPCCNYNLYKLRFWGNDKSKFIDPKLRSLPLSTGCECNFVILWSEDYLHWKWLGPNRDSPTWISALKTLSSAHFSVSAHHHFQLKSRRTKHENFCDALLGFSPPSRSRLLLWGWLQWDGVLLLQRPDWADNKHEALAIPHTLQPRILLHLWLQRLHPGVLWQVWQWLLLRLWPQNVCSTGFCPAGPCCSSPSWQIIRGGFIFVFNNLFSINDSTFDFILATNNFLMKW